jgi:hypothetical protein
MLLLPGGQSLEATGTYSGIRPRGVFDDAVKAANKAKRDANRAYRQARSTVKKVQKSAQQGMSRAQKRAQDLKKKAQRAAKQSAAKARKDMRAAQQAALQAKRQVEKAARKMADDVRTAVVKVPAKPFPPGPINRLPRQDTGVLNTQFNINANGPNPINSYLAIYLTTLIYPEFLDQLEGNPLEQKDSRAKSMHTNPTYFYNEFVRLTKAKNLFTNATYTWVYGTQQGGYDPEAMVIATPRAVFVVFRGTDRVGEEPSGFAGGSYQWAEWMKTNFRFASITPDLPTLGTGSKVHQGFWESLSFSKPAVIRQGQKRSCSQKPTYGPKSFRECLVGEIKAAGGSSKKVFIMGHSLGAAHAQLFAGYLAGHVTDKGSPDGIKPQGVFAVAAPHPGNSAFKDTLHRLVGKRRIQRFDFVNDPVTMLPPYRIGLSEYGRAGTRTYYDDIKTVQVGVKERVPGIGEPVYTNMAAGALIGGIAAPFVPGAPEAGAAAALFSDFCFHYPQWYLNAAWSAVPHQARRRLLRPLPSPKNEGPKPRVYSGCINPLTVARGERSERGRAGDTVGAVADATEQVVYNTGQLFNNLLANPVAPGKYYLRLLKGKKYLHVVGSCYGKNGCVVKLRDLVSGSKNRFRFAIKKEAGGYSLRNGSGAGSFVEVDGKELLKNGGRIQMWEANLPFGGHNGNQLWHFYKVPKRPNLYVIRNAATGKVMDAKNNCVKKNGCAVQQKNGKNNDPTQVWILEKVK